MKNLEIYGMLFTRFDVFVTRFLPVPRVAVATKQPGYEKVQF